MGAQAIQVATFPNANSHSQPSQRHPPEADTNFCHDRHWLPKLPGKYAGHPTPWSEQT